MSTASVETFVLLDELAGVAKADRLAVGSEHHHPVQIRNLDQNLAPPARGPDAEVGVRHVGVGLDGARCGFGVLP